MGKNFSIPYHKEERVDDDDDLLMNGFNSQQESIFADGTLKDIADGFLSETWWQTSILVASNLFLLFPLISAILKKMITRSLIISLALFSSCSYHYCKTLYPNICSKGDFLYFYHLDFFFSFLLVINSIMLFLPYEMVKRYRTFEPFTREMVYYYNYPLSPFMYEKLEFILTVIYAMVVSAIIFFFGEPTLIQYVGVLATDFVVVIIISIFVVRVYKLEPYYNRWFLFTGIFFVIIGLTLYSTQQFFDKKYYWIYHSLWHILGALGIFALLESKVKTKPFKS